MLASIVEFHAELKRRAVPHRSQHTSAALTINENFDPGNALMHFTFTVVG